VAPPSGIVTFLFTDIEGSTRRWESDADAMRAELATHDDVLRTAIESHGGWLFKHTGDGVCAAFTSPRAAIDAAVAAQRLLSLPVRMGIATGEAELRGDDYFGPALNRAARVMGAGHGGQILVVASTASLVTGVDLVDLGPRLLRDLSESVAIFQVRADGLRTEFPALKTLDGTPGNLRPQATSFIGRDDEVAELEAAVTAHRLVTLTGVGGVGKTRLALQVAANLAGDFPEGVFVIELAPVGDPAAVPDAAASELGIIQQAAMTVTESVAHALDGRHRLLVFDNCEHVLDAAAQLIEAILARSTTVKIITTSREGLRVAEEHLWPVPSLNMRDGLNSDGGTLFLERARTVIRGFAPTSDSDTAAIIDICQRLDGIPLAIELAASRMVSMTPSDVRDRLNDRFRLLAGGRRGVERHQTLRHAVQWSYDLLDDEERALLNRCSVFAGGFDLAAAVAIAGAGQLDEYAVIDLLDALVRKSLVTADRSGGHVRYAMLETIRQFAEDQLAATGESDNTRYAHARYYAGKETELLTLWNSPNQRDAHDWIDTELANLRNAFRWATDRGDLDTAAAIAVYASFIGYGTQHYEVIAWAEELIEPARAAHHPRLAALTVMACMCVLTNRLDNALRYSDDAQTLIDDPYYDKPPFGYAGLWLAMPHLYNGRPDIAVELCQADIERTGDPLTLARSAMAGSLAFAGRFDEAVALSGDLVATSERAANPAMAASALSVHAFASRVADPLGAIASARRAVALARDSGHRFYATVAATTLANLEVEHGDLRTALDLMAQTITSHHDAGDTNSTRVALANVVALCGKAGRYEPAAIIVGSASNPILEASVPEFAVFTAHLREVLGPERYETLTGQGAGIKPADAVRYALAEIELARREL
jgi:predicted ATPase